MQALESPQREVLKQKLRRHFSWRIAIIVGGILAVLAIVAAALVIFSQQHTPKAADSQAAAPVATVTTHTVTMTPVARQITASGSVTARHTVDIGAEASGLRITEVNVEEGDYVRRGQVLARMNADTLLAQLSREQANLQGAIASVEKARQPNRAEDIAGLQAAYFQAQASISQAQANVRRAESSMNNLRTTAQRYENLNKEGAVSEQEAQDRRTSATMAEADLSAAKQQLSAAQFAAQQAKERLAAAQAGGRQVDISISQASAAQIRATIRQIEAQIAQSVVHAPSDGIITKRYAEVGEIGAVSQPLFSMAKNGALELRAQVQETELPAVRSSQTVQITPASPELKPFSAVVREVAPQVDPKTRLGVVYIDVPGAGGLKEGMYASALIKTGNHLALTVPTKAVIADDAEKVVFIASGNKVVRRVIRTGTTSGDMVEVVSGLAPGEEVVVAGAGFLKDGDTVSFSKNVSAQVANH